MSKCEDGSCGFRQREYSLKHTQRERAEGEICVYFMLNDVSLGHVISQLV